MDNQKKITKYHLEACKLVLNIKYIWKEYDSIDSIANELLKLSEELHGENSHEYIKAKMEVAKANIYSKNFSQASSDWGKCYYIEYALDY